MSFRVSRCVPSSFLWRLGETKVSRKDFFEREQLEVAKKIPKKEGESFFPVFFRVATMREIKAPPRPISSIPIVPKKEEEEELSLSLLLSRTHIPFPFLLLPPGRRREKCDTGLFSRVNAGSIG